MRLRLSHIGICVSDLDRSLAFYRDGLGFEERASHRVGAEFGRLMEVDGVELRSTMLERDGITLELLAFESPGHTGKGDRRPMNELGFTHLSLEVDDLEEAAATVERFGGAVVSSTRTELGAGDARLEFVYCTDPDGVRVELMRLGRLRPAASAPPAAGRGSDGWGTGRRRKVP